MGDPQHRRTTREKLALFRACFTGLPHVYGTYDPKTGRVRQVKQPVTDRVILDHLLGRQPYGVYLLVDDRTRALAVDFDTDDLNPVMQFVAAAKNHGLATYIERSKSKGYHVWMFFEEAGVKAAKARRVARYILGQTGMSGTEAFPKQNCLDGPESYGNFINAPLFGALVPQGRTVFVDENNPLQPYADQWEFLASIQRIPEPLLDSLLARLEDARVSGAPSRHEPPSGPVAASPTFGLPPCARRMLREGVNENQRVACFHLALQLRKAGLPQDIAVAGLCAWAMKNRPNTTRRLITVDEIHAQTRSAYAKDYRGCGCEATSVTPFCDPCCPLRRHTHAGPAGQASPRSETSSPQPRAGGEGGPR